MLHKYKTVKMPDSFMFGLDGKILCNTLYYVININGNFDIEAYKKSLKYVVKDLPVLSCKFSLGFWRDKWEYIDNFNIEQIFEEIYLEKSFSSDKNSFYEFAFSEFIKLENNRINITKEAPFKIKVFSTKQLENKVIIWSIHHTVTDGRGMLQIIKLAGKYYNAILNGKSVDKIIVREKKSKGEFFTNLTNIFEVTSLNFRNLFKKNTVPKLESIIEIEEIQSGEAKYDSMSVEKFKIGIDEINKLKPLYGTYKFTINDVILHNILKLNMNYGLNFKKYNTHIKTDVRIDIRKYLKKKQFSIGNYSVPKTIYIKRGDLYNIPEIYKCFGSFKNSSECLKVFYSYYILGIFPVKFIRYILSKMTEKFLIDSYSGMSSSNVGKIDQYVEPYGEIIDDIFFIPCGGSYSFPLMCISGYKDKLTISFIKYNDKNKLTKRIKDDFKKILDEDLTKI